MEHAPSIASSSVSSQKPYDLGILLVHGIGNQRAGETLTTWGDAIIEVLERTMRGKLSVEVGRAYQGGNADISPETVLELGHPQGNQRWLLSEAWWAQTFPSPTYKELVLWSVRALPWTLLSHLATAIQKAELTEAPTTNGARKPLKAALLEQFGLLVAMAFAPILVLALFLVLLLGLLPITQLRTWLLRVQNTLTATIGDSLVFVESPVRTGFIRTQLLESIAGLKKQCDRILIVAHSQGAAIVVDTLIGLIPDRLRQINTDAMPDTLVTFGAGINKLQTLSKIANRGDTYRIWLAVWALAVVAFASVYAGAEVYSGRTTVLSILTAMGLLTFLVLFLSTIVILAQNLARRLASSKRPHLKRHGPKAAEVLMVLLLLFSVASAIYFWGSGVATGIAILIVGGLSYSYRMLGAVKEEMRGLFPILLPERPLPSWLDFYASADPVPNGPVCSASAKPQSPAVSKQKRLHSQEISNQGSVFADHSSYWENLDTFVLPVITACAQTAESPWAAGLPPVSSLTRARSRWRVKWLQLTRMAVFAIWIVLPSLFLITNPGALEEILPARIPMQKAIPARFATGPTLLSCVFFGVGAFMTYGVIKAMWKSWATREQRAILTREGVNEASTFTLAFSYVLLAAFVGVVWSLSGAKPPPETSLADSLKGFALLAVVIWQLGRGLRWALNKLIPPPDGSSESEEQPVTKDEAHATG